MSEEFDLHDIQRKRIWKEVSPKAWDTLMYIMSGVEPNDEAEFPCGGGMEINVEPLPPYMAYIVFVTLLGFRYWGRGEKVAWTIPIRFRGHRLFVSHEKFGFKVRAPEISPEVEAAARELVHRLSRAARVADKLIEPVIKDQIRRGHVTLRNQYHLFRDRYEFLREQASLAFASKPPNPVVVRRDEVGRPTTIISNPFKPVREGFFLALSMLDAWFSYLEHITVLLLPFYGFDPTQDDLVRFMEADWATKFNRIYKPNSNPEMMRLYNELRGIKERFRNTFAHGGYEKRGASLLVHWPGTGAIPVTLSRFPDSVHFSFFPMLESSYNNLCKLLDRADELMRIGTYGRTMRFLEAGLDVFFDEHSRKDYARALESDEALEALIEYQGYLQDQACNMDW